MNPEFVYYDGGMMNFNFNCLQNIMVDDMKDLLYFKITQENIALREELRRRDQIIKVEYYPNLESLHNSTTVVTKVEDCGANQELIEIGQSDIKSFKSSKSSDIVAKKHQGCKNSPRNETKNISKNFGKAIICFAEQNKELTRRILSSFPDLTIPDFINYLRSKKRKINSISDLR